jgi:hypothetical protein
LVEHRIGQQLEAAVGTTVAKPRSNRERQSSKAFFMRQFSFRSLRRGPFPPYFFGCLAGGHRDSALSTFQPEIGYQPSG